MLWSDPPPSFLEEERHYHSPAPFLSLFLRPLRYNDHESRHAGGEEHHEEEAEKEKEEARRVTALGEAAGTSSPCDPYVSSGGGGGSKKLFTSALFDAYIRICVRLCVYPPFAHHCLFLPPPLPLPPSTGALDAAAAAFYEACKLAVDGTHSECVLKIWNLAASKEGESESFSFLGGQGVGRR